MLIVILLLLGMTACTTVPSALERSRYQAEPGYQLYVNANCAKCHGKYGQGIFGKQVIRGLPFTASSLTAKVRGEGSTVMPIYQTTASEGDGVHFISDTDLLTLADFLASNWSSASVEK